MFISHEISNFPIYLQGRERCRTLEVEGITMEKCTTIEGYLASLEEPAKEKLNELRMLVQALAPDAVECISYGIPTFKLNGNLIHFGAYRRHIGLYPGAAGIQEFANRFGNYTYSKGAVQFPLDQPLPLALIQEIIEYRIHKQRESVKKSRIKKAAR
jgi:uncharacterized protein YdhG (YjbR/CyaY superfamily)